MPVQPRSKYDLSEFNSTVETTMAKGSKGGDGSKGGSGKGGGSKGPAGWPSKTGKPSCGERDNAPRSSFLGDGVPPGLVCHGLRRHGPVSIRPFGALTFSKQEFAEMNDYRVHPSRFLRSICSMVSALVVAAALVGSEAMAHGTQTFSGYTGENYECSFAQSEANLTLEKECRDIPRTQIVQQWAPVSWKVSQCQRRQTGTDMNGNPRYSYRADWKVTCGPYGEWDHNPMYHDQSTPPSNMRHSH